MADDVVSHAFSHGFHPEHTVRLAAYLTEALGGPLTYSDTCGDETSVVQMHSGNGPHEEMDRRAIACFDQALEDVGLAGDDRLRQVAASIDLGGSVTSVAVRRVDGVVAAATVGSGIAILDPDGTEIARVAQGMKVVGSVTWAADGSFLLASAPTGATVWAVDGLEPVRSLDAGPGSILPVALSVDGSRIALGWDHHVGLWSADEAVDGATIEGLPKGVYGLSFSHDARLLAAAAADGRVRAWSVT